MRPNLGLASNVVMYYYALMGFEEKIKLLQYFFENIKTNRYPKVILILI